MILQSVFKRQHDEWRSSSNCGQIAANIARFNSENSEIVGRKFTKFGHDVAWLLALDLLKADLRSVNSLLNAEAKWWTFRNRNCDIAIRFRTAVRQRRLVREKRRFIDFNWLLWQRPLKNQEKLNEMNKPLQTSTNPDILVKIGP